MAAVLAISALVATIAGCLPSGDPIGGGVASGRATPTAATEPQSLPSPAVGSAASPRQVGSASTSPATPAGPNTPTPGSTAAAKPAGAPSPKETTPTATSGRLFLPNVVVGGGPPDSQPAAALTPAPEPTAPPAPGQLTPEAAKPPATPAPPAPTAAAAALERVKLPPSPYQRLQDYPRPPGDSGFGFHINAEPKPPSREMLQTRIIPLMKSLGATWVTVYCSSADVDEWLQSVKLLVDSGFEVIIRYHHTHTPPHPDFVPTVDAIKRFRAIGVNYVVTGNEPNLSLENRSRAGADQIARQWVKASDNIKAAGAIPLLYPMSPGRGDVADAREMLVGMLEWLKAHDALDTLDGAGIAIHNRPLGKPLDYRDSTSFLEYEWIDDTVARYAGKRLPLFGTEAGYAFGEQILPRFPKVDGELHKQYNLGIIAGFRDGRWRDGLFAQTFWLLGGFGYREFLADWWVENPLNHGQDLPIVDALKALPKFTRKFGEPGFQTRPRP